MAGSTRTITTVMRAETGQYERSMDSAAKSTAKVGTAADATGKSVSSAAQESSKIGTGAEQSSRKAGSALSRMSSNVGKNRQAWVGVGTALTAAGGAVTAFGVSALKTGIEYNTLQQTSRAALTSILGSAKAANEQMDKLDDFAKTSPFSKSTFIDAQQQMLAFGIEAQKVVPYLDAIQNAVAAAGGSNDDIAAISATMSQIQSSAKITGEDLNELGNRGVNAAELIGSQMGMTGAQVRDAISNGTIGASDALDALADGMSERFSGAAANVKNTFGGAMDRVSAAWRDFSADLAKPLVNPKGGGALVDMLNKVADAMRAFGDLPDPIKNLITSLGLLGGVAATAAGGLILLAPKVAELWGNFQSLAESSPKATAALKGFGKAAGVATAVYAVAGATGALVDQLTRGETAVGSNTLQKAIEDTVESGKGLSGMDVALSNTGTVLGLASVQADSLTDAFDQMLDPSATDRMSMFFDGIPGVTGYMEKLQERVGGVDEALASMAESGDTQTVQQFMDMYAEAGYSAEDLAQILPQATDAMVGASSEADTAAASVQNLATWQDVLASALESTDPALAAQAESMQGLIDSVGKAGGAFVDLSDDLGKSKFSLDGWLDKLDEQADALEKWSDNIANLSKRGASQELLQGLIDQGPKAAKAVNALANGSKKDLSRAEDAFGRTTGAVGGLQDKLGKGFKVSLNTAPAKKDGESLEAYIGRLQATITVKGDTVPAREDGESAKHYIDRLKSLIEVDANGKPARSEGKKTRADIQNAPPAAWNLKANGAPAKSTGKSTSNSIGGMKPNQWNLTAQGAPAIATGKSTSGTIGSMKPDPFNLSANGAPAVGDARSATNTIDGMDATVDVKANTSSARSSVGSWLNSIPRTITTTVNQYISKHNIGGKGKATGGAISGPGSGTSDDVPVMLSNGEHVLTSSDVEAMGGQAGVYDFRSALHRGQVEGYASGGAVSSAESALRRAASSRKTTAGAVARARGRVRAAEKAQRDAEKTDRKSDDKRARKTLARRQKALKDAEARLSKRDNEVSKQRSRLSSLRDTKHDTAVDVHRGDIREQAAGGLSGAYSVVDQMQDLARSGNLTKKQAGHLSKSASNAEKNMRRLYAQADKLESKLAAARDRVQELASIKANVKDSLVGGFALGDVEGKTNPWTGEAGTATGKTYLASAQAYAAKTKTFAAKLKALQKKGYPGAILQEVAGLGVEAGIPAADALLSLNTKDTASMKTAWSNIDKYSGQAGQYVTEGFYKGGVSAAQGVVKGLASQQKGVEKQITKMAKGMEKALKKALGIKSPSKVGQGIGANFGGSVALGITSSAGQVARASEQLVSIPGQAVPSVYANPAKTSTQVVAVVDKGAMADAMNGMKMTLNVDGKPITAIAQTTVDHNLAAVATSLRGGRR